MSSPISKRKALRSLVFRGAAVDNRFDSIDYLDKMMLCRVSYRSRQMFLKLCFERLRGLPVHWCDIWHSMLTLFEAVMASGDALPTSVYLKHNVPFMRILDLNFFEYVLRCYFVQIQERISAVT